MVCRAGDNLSSELEGSVGPLKVLLVAPEPFFTVRGTPFNVLQMCRALTGLGHEVHLATYPMGEDVKLPGLTIQRCVRVPGIRHVPIGFSLRKIVQDIPLAGRVYGLLIDERYDVIHAVEESVFFCLPAARLTGTPVIYDLDSSISDQLEYANVVTNRVLLRLVRAIERASLRRVDCAITVCRSLTEFASQMGRETRIFQIEDTPLSSSLREPDPNILGQLRRDLDLDGRRVLVYTGNLEGYQGIDLLLQAIVKVVADYPDAVFVLVGGEADDIANVNEQAFKLGISEHLRLPGMCDPEEMPEYMALGEGLLSPRVEGENTPLKVYTYMHSGRPIVATDLPTHTQVLDPSVAVLADPTPEGLAAGVAKVLDEPERCAVLGTAARARVAREYSFEAFQRKLSQAYAWATRKTAQRSPDGRESQGKRLAQRSGSSG